MLKRIGRVASSVAVGILLPNITIMASNVPSSKPITNSPSRAQITIVGSPLPPPQIPKDAIYLNPGESIPSSAQIGQTFVSPKVLPPNWKHMLVLHINAGQGAIVKGYNGPIIIEPTYPTVTTIKPMGARNSTNTISPLISGQPVNTTAVLDSYFQYSNVSGQQAGGILDFDGKWVADNHTLNYYSPYTGAMYPPTKIEITNSGARIIAESTNVEDINNQALGLASPYNVGAPTGSSYGITVVQNPTVGQQDVVVGAWQPSSGSYGVYTQNETLTAVRVNPPYDPWPDSTSNIYHEFSPNVPQPGQGWSGTGVWDSQNHLIAMIEGGSAAYNTAYGFNGGDIKNFCSEYNIPYAVSSGS